MSPVSLKPSALQEAIQRSAVVLFYAPWCGHCERFMSTYEAFSEEASIKLPGFIITKINYDKYGQEVKQMNIGEHLVAGGVSDYVKGFPTIAFFHQNRMSIYKGERASQKILESVQSFMAEVEGERTSEEEMFQNKELLSVDEPVAKTATEITPANLASYMETPSMVMMYAPWCGHCKRAMSALDNAADILGSKNIKVAKMDYERYGKEVLQQKIGASLLEQQGFTDGIASTVKGFPTILMFSGKDVAQYTGPRTAEALVSTMNEFSQTYA